MAKKKTWREDAKQKGCLIGGIANIEYYLDGRKKHQELKFVGKFWHIEELDRTENDPYFKGVLFDMDNNEQGSIEWTKDEFYENCKTFTELF